MSRIPDCRRDEFYNQKYLVGGDSEFVDGYDFAAVHAADNYFDNIDCYRDDFEIEGEDINLVRFLENHPKIFDMLRQTQQDWIEHQRDELITSMIDNMGEEEYERRKKNVDSGNGIPFVPISEKLNREE